MSRRRQGMGGSVALAALLLFRSAAEAATFLAAAEAAPMVVVASVGAPKKIDVHGYRAPLHIERAVGGDRRGAGEAVVGWEELSPARKPRLSDGARVLLALAPLPTTSLWRSRFAGEKQTVYVIDDESNAVLAVPAAGVVDALAVYLALSPAERQRTRGVGSLVTIASLDSPLASQAVERLRQNPTLPTAIDADATKMLAALTANASRPLTLRAAVVALAGDRRLVGLRPALESLAQPGSALEAEALTALAQLDGGFDPARAAALLGREQPAMRAVGARTLRGPLAERELPKLVRSDPSPLVRTAAAEALAASGTVWGMEGAVEALADTDAGVRTAAAQAVAARGTEAMPFLQAALKSNGATAAGAVVTLSLMGTAGRDVLATTARTHPNPQVRTLAELALGKAPGHTH